MNGNWVADWQVCLSSACFTAHLTGLDFQVLLMRISSAPGSNNTFLFRYRLHKPRWLRHEIEFVNESLDERPKYPKISNSFHSRTTSSIGKRILQRKLRIETPKVRTSGPTESAGKHYKGNFFKIVIKAAISVYYWVRAISTSLWSNKTLI